MPKAICTFLVVVGLFAVFMILIPVAGHNANDYVGYVIFLEFVVLLPLLVVTGWDALGELNSSAEGSSIVRIAVRLLASVPALVFGLLSLVCGIAIIVWVLYNDFIERRPEFTGTWFTGFGIGPALVVFGTGLLVSIFRTFARVSKSGAHKSGPTKSGSIFRLAFGSCSCQERQAPGLRQSMCREMLSRLSALRAKPDQALTSLPAYRETSAVVEGRVVSFETISVRLPDETLLVVVRAFAKSWWRPNWFAFSGTGYMFADGFLVATNGARTDATDEIMWNFR